MKHDPIIAILYSAAIVAPIIIMTIVTGYLFAFFGAKVTLAVLATIIVYLLLAWGICALILKIN